MSSPASDRRSYPRHPHESVVNVTIISASNDALVPGRSFQCRSIDISMAGLQVHSEQSLDCGTKLEMWVVSPLFQDTMVLVGRVQWSRKIDDHTYAAGIQLSVEESDNIETWRQVVALMPTLPETPAN